MATPDSSAKLEARRWLRDTSLIVSPCKKHFFTALHGMQTQSSGENSVRLVVCPSVKRVHCDKTEEKSVHILYHTKDYKM